MAEPEPSGPVVTLSMRDVDPLIGAEIAGRYRLLEKIGEGGMGVVYRGSTTSGEKVAVKLLLPELGRVEEVARRFEREAQAMGRLRHENIVRVVDFGKLESGALYLVMELLDGKPLTSAMRVGGRLPVDRALRIARQILRALDHAHANGVIHRDLKPENIVLLRGQNDRVKILDFGIAKICDERSNSEMIKLTQAGLVLGTPEYMAPEQASGWDVDARTDVYSCGVLLFELLTGRKPFEATSAVELMIKLNREAVPSLRSVAPDAEIPALLDAAVRRALDKDREGRFPSAAAFHDALDGRQPEVTLPTRVPGRLRRIASACAYTAERVWRAWWGSPRIMSLRVRTRLWWVTRPRKVRQAIAIGAVLLWLFGASAFFLLRGSRGQASAGVAPALPAQVEASSQPAPPPPKPPKPSRERARRRHSSPSAR